MSFHRIQQHFTTAIAILLCSGFAIFCGSLIGEGQFKVVALIFGGVTTIATVIVWRAGIWLLIPLCWELTGKIPAADLPFTPRDIAVGIAATSFLIFYALKLLRAKPAFDLLDLLVLLNLAYLATVFMRNPVGVDWLGSNMVGGRPYFDIFIGFLAFLVLSRAPSELRSIRHLPFLICFAPAFVSLGSLVTQLAPSTISILGSVYSGFAPPEIVSGAAEVEDMIGRKPALAGAGIVLMRLACSYYRPLSLLVPRNWLGFIGAVGGMVAILLSGFRGALLVAFVYMALSTYLRKRSRDIVVFGAIGILALSFISLGNNRFFSLPPAAQRTLSFLPGKWDRAAADDAKGSSEWRFEMWQWVLSENQWIKNKWLGDGFGFTRQELEIMRSREGFIGATNQEANLINGGYHSGPLSAIRYVGFVGLLLYLALIFMLAVRAFRLIRLAYGTGLFAVALFVGMPVFWKPFDYVFIFGGFDSSFPETLMMAGLIKLLDRAHKRFKAELGTPPGAGVSHANDTSRGTLATQPIRLGLSANS